MYGTFTHTSTSKTHRMEGSTHWHPNTMKYLLCLVASQCLMSSGYCYCFQYTHTHAYRTCARFTAANMWRHTFYVLHSTIEQKFSIVVRDFVCLDLFLLLASAFPQRQNNNNKTLSKLFYLPAGIFTSSSIQCENCFVCRISIRILVETRKNVIACTFFCTRGYFVKMELLLLLKWFCIVHRVHDGGKSIFFSFSHIISNGIHTLEIERGRGWECEFYECILHVKIVRWHWQVATLNLK